MTDYTFRFLFRLPRSRRISIQDHSIKLSIENYSGELFGEAEKSIEESSTLIFKGSGFLTEEEAFTAGKKIRDSIMLACAYCRIGADFGDDTLHGGLSKYLIDKLEGDEGVRSLNEVNGLMVYETDPDPKIFRIGPVTGGIKTSHEKFIEAFNKVSLINYSFSENERVSYDLFSNSFFTSNGYARFLFLIMAVEVLIDQIPRPIESIEYVESFINSIKNSNNLSDPEKNSLIGSLNNLRFESIRQGSRKLIDSKLPDNKYNGLKASKFFLDCYDLRSHIVHGSQPFPSEREVDHAAAVLEILVANLLSSCLTCNSR